VLPQRAVRLDLRPQIGIVTRAAKEVSQAAEARDHRGILVMLHASRVMPVTRDYVVPNTC